jgi:cysteine desulfurase/selenocysteine lyase
VGYAFERAPFLFLQSNFCVSLIHVTRIYLDNAATSYPKPESVYAAVDHYQRHIGVAIGRGAYREAMTAQRTLDQCRQSAARLLGAESPHRIVFTLNGTDSLNMALLGVCRPGDHVITTEFEHNSVLRPLRWLKDHRGLDVTVLCPQPSGQIDPRQVRSQIRPTTRLVAVQQASNVTGVIQPIDEICAIAREANVLTLVDAAQSAGHLPIDLSQLPIDLLACPGHKGLLGPLGTGLLYVRSGVEQAVTPYRLGGTGTQSEDDRQPDAMPDRFEAGNHNAPGLAGLAAGLAFLEERTVTALQHAEAEITAQLVQGLREIPGVTVYGHQAAVPSVGVVSFNIAGFAPHEAASILDESFGIQARAGLHCAPGVHRFLGTFENGGTIRFSVGAFTSIQDIEQALASIRELTGA